MAPFSTDMYLPAFTALAEDMGTTASAVQLTLTAFFVGLATGQLVIGPLSDRFGRRPPLLVATAFATLASAACALAPEIWVLIAARFVQGFAGAAGIVIARAATADRVSGTAAARVFSLLASIGGLAPVVAPLAGGVLVPFGWRAEFWALTAICALMLLGSLFVVGESLPPERRHGGGLAATGRNVRRLLADRGYVGYVLAYALGFGGLMSYISASPFVIEGVLGLSTTAYTVAFAVNALGMVATGLIGARLVTRFRPRALLTAGQTLLLTLSAALLAAIALGAPAPVVLPILFFLVSSVTFILGNGSALAIGRAPWAAGTAAAVMGALQFAVGALVSPLVGVAGEDTALPMAVSLVVTAALSLTARLLTRGAPDPAPSPAREDVLTTA
ncbi:Bcr/CflA family efflux MFS transporter [Bailinhaonella thermotolerans]|uniref:Bcr/CflA family efflux MFS transporter n=2 Tax=Bailinhaonella thermotolerans TaxID=1070861 RepID=A0A3A4B3Z8_9ACTN|nr:Bcr/CflA family efflux MFS transporter [Bailinhaonella thermotolerans]